MRCVTFSPRERRHQILNSSNLTELVAWFLATADLCESIVKPEDGVLDEEQIMTDIAFNSEATTSELIATDELFLGSGEEDCALEGQSLAQLQHERTLNNEELKQTVMLQFREFGYLRPGVRFVNPREVLTGSDEKVQFLPEERQPSLGRNRSELFSRVKDCSSERAARGDAAKKSGAVTGRSKTHMYCVGGVRLDKKCHCLRLPHDLQWQSSACSQSDLFQDVGIVLPERNDMTILPGAGLSVRGGGRSAGGLSVRGGGRSAGGLSVRGGGRSAAGLSVRGGVRSAGGLSVRGGGRSAEEEKRRASALTHSIYV